MSSEVKVYIGADASDFSAKMKLAQEEVHGFKKSLREGGELGGIARLLGPVGAILAIGDAFKKIIGRAQELRDKGIEAGHAIDGSTEAVARLGDTIQNTLSSSTNWLEDQGAKIINRYTVAAQIISYALGKALELAHLRGKGQTEIYNAAEDGAYDAEQSDKGVQSVIKPGQIEDLKKQIQEANDKLALVGLGDDAKLAETHKQADEATQRFNDSTKKLNSYDKSDPDQSAAASKEKVRNGELNLEMINKIAAARQADHDHTQKITDANTAFNQAQIAAKSSTLGEQAKINLLTKQAVELEGDAMKVTDDKAKKKQMEAQVQNMLNDATERQRQLNQQIADINDQIANAQATRQNIGLSQIEIAKQEYDQAQKLFAASKEAGDAGDPLRAAKLQLDGENMLNDSIQKTTAYKEALVSLEQQEHQMMMDRASIGASTEQNINTQLANAYNILNNIAPLEQDSLKRAKQMLDAQQQITAAMKERYNQMSSGMSIEDIAKGSSPASVHARNSIRLKKEADEADKSGNYEYGIKLRNQANQESEQAFAPESNAVKKAMGLPACGSGSSGGGGKNGSPMDAGINAQKSSLDAGIELEKAQAAGKRTGEYYDATTGKVNTLPAMNVAGHPAAPAKTGDNAAKNMAQTFQSIDKQMQQLVAGIQKLGAA